MTQVSNEIIEALQVLREHLDSQAVPNTTVVLSLLFQKMVTGESKTTVSYRLEQVPKKAEAVVESAPVRQEKVVLVAVDSKSESVPEVAPVSTPVPVSSVGKESSESKKAKPSLVF